MPQSAEPPNGMVLVRAADVIMRPKEWIWIGHLLRGAQELLTGLPGLGKSQVHCSFAGCVTTGAAWPDGTPGKAPASVIMVTAEDTLDQEIVPRLIAAGADLTRVHFVRCIRTVGIARQQRQFLLSEDLDALARKVTQLGDVALIMIDPITAFMGGQLNSHMTTAVRSQLGPLKDFAEANNVAVSTITHPAKNPGNRAIDHFIGSQAFIAAGRIGHACFEEIGDDEKPTGRVLFTNPKNNPSVKMPTLAYRVEAIVVGQENGVVITAPRVVWANTPVAISADAAAGLTGPQGKRDGSQEKVRQFLRTLLADGQPKLYSEIVDEARQRGFTPKQLTTAKDKLGVISKKGTNNVHGPWNWELPEEPM
jgi:putative DNA primase/helicase